MPTPASPPDAPVAPEFRRSVADRRHRAGLARIVGGVILILVLAAAIVSLVAARFGWLPLGETSKDAALEAVIQRGNAEQAQAIASQDASAMSDSASPAHFRSWSRRARISSAVA